MLRTSRVRLLALVLLTAGLQPALARDEWEGDFTFTDRCASEGVADASRGRYVLRMRQLSPRYFGFHLGTCQGGTGQECEMTGVARKTTSDNQLLIVSTVSEPGAVCKATIRRKGGTLSIAVQEGCKDFCSPNAGLDGATFSRRAQ